MKTLSRRILTLVLPLIIIPALLSGFFSLAVVPYYFSREFTRNLETSLVGWEMEFVSLEKQLSQLGSFIIKEEPVIKAVEEWDRQYLLLYLADLISRDRLDNAEFLDAEGFVIAEAHRPANYGHFEGDRFSFLSLSNRTSVSGLEMTDLGVGVIYKTEILKEGERVGVLEISRQLNLSLLQTMKEKFGLDSIIFFGSSLQATTLTDPEALKSPYLLTLSNQFLETGDQVLTSRRLNGKPYYLLVERIGSDRDNPAFLYLLQSSSSIRFITGLSLVFYTLTIMVIIILTLIMTGNLTSRIVKPLTQMSDASRLVSEGKFGSLVHVEGDEEIVALSETFNYMNSRLKVMVEDLEEQVAERTRHLEEEVLYHRETKKEISVMRQYQRDILDSMPSILLSVDGEGKVSTANKMALEYYGEHFEQGKRDYKEIFPQIRKVLEQGFSLAKSGNPYSVNSLTIFGDGEERFLDLAVFVLESKSDRQFIVRIDDVTEREKLDQHMVQSEKMLSVGGLAAGMAHEINNPLAGMIQTASVMAKRLTDKTLAANVKAVEETGFTMEQLSSYMEARGINKMIESIRASGMRVSEIVKDMLDFARKEEKSYSSYSLIEIMETSLKLCSFDYNLKKEYDFRDIEIVKDYEDDKCLVLCESGKIQQVFLNILKNGAEAMHESYNSGIRPRFLIKIVNEGDEWILVEIEDNGPGMKESVRKRIFEPFFTTKPEGVGTGLGLSVSYFIITENHKGRMEVQSQIGKGTKFSIRIPRFQK